MKPSTPGLESPFMVFITAMPIHAVLKSPLLFNDSHFFALTLAGIAKKHILKKCSLVLFVNFI